MDRRTIAAVQRGIESALLASVPQVLLPKLEEKLLFDGDEPADLGPAFIEALAERVEQPLPEDVKWLGASAFHFGYAAVWGTLYALVYERKPVPPWVGGTALSALVHGITFPRWGGAVVSGTEPRPEERSWRREVIHVTAAATFGFTTALLYGRGPGWTVGERIRREWRKRTS